MLGLLLLLLLYVNRLRLVLLWSCSYLCFIVADVFQSVTADFTPEVLCSLHLARLPSVEVGEVFGNVDSLVERPFLQPHIVFEFIVPLVVYLLAEQKFLVEGAEVAISWCLCQSVFDVAFCDFSKVL